MNLLGECTTVIAHELNQPLTAILRNAQAARKHLAGNSSSRQVMAEILDDIVRDDKRASDIIQRMRAMPQNNEIVREWFDLNEAVREAVHMLAGEFKTNNIELSQSYAPAAPEVYAGRIEIQQVILNLLVNAVRAMKHKRGKDRLVSICRRVSNHEVEVDIEDNARGLPDDAHEALFNTIYYKSADGLGMGLTIRRRIVETCGGRIRARNADSGGAVCSFSLPRRASTQN